MSLADKPSAIRLAGTHEMCQSCASQFALRLEAGCVHLGHQALQNSQHSIFVRFRSNGCRIPRLRPRYTSVKARSNEVATVSAATVTAEQSPATVQPDGSVLSAPGFSSTQTLERRQLQGREVEERALDCCVQAHQERPNGLRLPSRFGDGGLDEAYERCGVVTASYAKTFYLGTQLMTPEKAKAVWAVYVWCRRTDELVDGPNASRITPEVHSTDLCARCPCSAAWLCKQCTATCWFKTEISGNTAASRHTFVAQQDCHDAAIMTTRFV